MNAEISRVESFVLRFVEDVLREESPSTAARWHAVVTHVQTGEAKPFADFADAIAFIARYVPIGNFVLQENDIGLSSVHRSVADEK